MNGAYQIINFDDIEFTTGTAELVVGAYKKITDTAKRFVITHLNLEDEVYKDIQLTFENVEGTFVGTGVVNGKLAVVSIASTDQVTVSLNDIAGDITSLENQVSLLNGKVSYNERNVISETTDITFDTANFLFTAPDDGYIEVLKVGDSEATSNAGFSVGTPGSILAKLSKISKNYDSIAIFIRKGTKIYCVRNVNDISLFNFYFRSYIEEVTP